MAIDGATIGVSRAGVPSASWFAEAGYGAFLLLIFVGLAPFAIRDPVVMAAQESGFSGAGDLLREICYIAVFGLILFAALRQRGMSAITIVPPVLALLLAWCLLSAMWSPEAGVTARRAVLAIAVVLSAMLGVATVGAERALKLWRYVLAGVLIVNWLSILVVPQAVHLPGEIDPSLIGDWRGLYFHKNIAGAVTAISAIVFLFTFLKSHRAVDALLFMGAVGFLLMTHSKASIGLLPVALLIGLIYRAAWRRGIDRLIVTVLLALSCAFAAAFVIGDFAHIASVFEDPNRFTGRSAIWQAEIAYIHDHPLLGSGFGAFADTGALSPLLKYVDATWVQNVSHGHNAYLQLFVTIGGVGFALAMWSLVLSPAISFWRGNPAAIDMMAMLFAIFVFVVLHNFLESDFLEGDGPAWVAFVLMLAMLRLSRAAPAAEAMP
jgi:exopolysaccharide production protein ExoQ